MGDRSADRRSQPRCTKTVNMHCACLHGRAEHKVTLRNFNSRGLYFESGLNLAPGTFVVIRAMAATEQPDGSGATPAIPDVAGDADARACDAYRSHSVAKVLHCRRLAGLDDPPRYGVGAAIQMLADG